MAERYDTERLPEVQELEDVRETVTDAGVFRWFKGNWRSARKRLLSYGRTKKVKFNDLLALLNSLIEFVRDKKKLEEDRSIRELLGKHFTGIDTDIETLIEIRKWYRGVRQAYGVGFGHKVALGNAVIDMPSSLGRAIRSLAERDVSRQIDCFLDEILRLKNVFGPVDDLQLGKVELVGEDGVLGRIQRDLRIALEPCQSVMQESNISLRGLSEQISRLDKLKRMVEKLRATDFDNRIFQGQLGLTPGVGVDNEHALNLARYTETLAQIIDGEIGSPLVKVRIYNDPADSVFESLREIGKLLKQALEIQTATMSEFSSMGAEDIVVTGTSKRGVRTLKDFLAYVETGILHKTEVDAGRAPDSDFEVAVTDALRQEGFECLPQVGVAGFFIDIAVKDPGNPGRYLMGIECDGATYHSAKSVRDRDRLRQAILERLGWRIRRIWSTDWFKNPQAELLPIIRKLHELKTIRPLQEETESEAEEIQDIIKQVEQEEEKVVPFVSEELDLKQKLIHFDKEVIRKELPDIPEDMRLLRPAMLEALLEYCPASKKEFLEHIPPYLRYATTASEGKYLDSVLEIIDESCAEN